MKSTFCCICFSAEIQPFRAIRRHTTAPSTTLKVCCSSWMKPRLRWRSFFKRGRSNSSSFSSSGSSSVTLLTWVIPSMPLRILSPSLGYVQMSSPVTDVCALAYVRLCKITQRCNRGPHTASFSMTHAWYRREGWQSMCASCAHSAYGARPHNLLLWKACRCDLAACWLRFIL